MEQQFSVLALAFSVFASFLGGVLFILVAKARAASIRSKIDDIDFEIGFLDRVSKGNIQLLRSAFGVFSYGFFLAFTALAIISVSQVLALPSAAKTVVLVIGGMMLFASGMFFLLFGNSMQRLKKLDASKEKLQEKKKKLEAKL